MVYKKYITRGGKTYGPYIYHSKRVDGKVVSEYHGSKKEVNYKKYLLIFLGVGLVLALFFIFSSGGRGITGKSILTLEADYQKGEPLEGVIRLSLKEGELLPASSKIIFESFGKKYEYLVSDVISEDVVEGDFYIEGKDISGTGSGYGIEGIAKISSDISFILDVYSVENSGQIEESAEQAVESGSKGEIEASNEENGSVLGVIEEEIIAEVVENSEVEETVPSITGGVITGNLILGLDTEINGEVSADEAFTYELQEGQTAEIRLKSVETDLEDLSESVLDIEINENLVVVTTDYSIKENGFGEYYLGDKLKTFSISLSDLGLIFDEGELKINIVYAGEELVSLTTILKDDSKVETQSGTPVVQEIDKIVLDKNTKETEEIKIISATVLTNEEIEVLIDEFGTISVDTIRSEIVGDKIVIGYQLGEHRIEYVYAYSQDQDLVKEKAESDKNKWLKDIAQKIISKKNVFNEEYIL